MKIEVHTLLVSRDGWLTKPLVYQEASREALIRKLERESAALGQCSLIDGDLIWAFALLADRIESIDWADCHMIRVQVDGKLFEVFYIFKG